MRIVLTPQARADYVEAVDWYAHQAPGLEKRIRAAFRTVRLRMMENPDQFPQATVATRRALLRDFPYVVVFRVSGDVVEVIDFFHTSRDPRRWQERQ